MKEDFKVSGEESKNEEDDAYLYRRLATLYILLVLLALPYCRDRLVVRTNTALRCAESPAPPRMPRMPYL